jgi:hypothetical protein
MGVVAAPQQAVSGHKRKDRPRAVSFGSRATSLFVVNIDQKDRHGISHRPCHHLFAITAALIRICQPDAQNRKVIAEQNAA